MFADLLLMVGTGALIGGVTNYLAIMMLFRPHKAYYLGKWRIPFTPGLIPKRHAEIAEQFGQVVENYLLTETLIKEALLSPRLKENVERELGRLLERHLAHNPLTLREMIGELPEEGKRRLEECLEDSENRPWHGIVARWLRENREKRVEEILGLGEEEVERYSFWIAAKLVKAANRFLASPRGKELCAEMLESLFRRQNPLVRFLAGQLLKEERIADFLLPRLQETLSGWRAEKRIGELIRVWWREWSGRTLAELLGGMDEREAAVRLLGLLGLFRLDERVAKWLDEPLSVWGGKAAEWARPFLPALAGWMVGWLERNLPRLYANLNLAGLVSSQVKAFPLPRLEQMILGVTGKEFKAITFLGALLGGMVGLVQFFLVLGLG